MSNAAKFETPFGTIPVDQDVRRELLENRAKFHTMDITVDEAEHSLENQLPWLAQVMEGHPFTLIPIMVGSLSDESEAAYGKILAPYCEGPSVFGGWVPLLT